MSDDKGRNELATIEQTMRDRPAEYRRDENLQARYRDLVDARETGAALPAKSGAREARKAEIEKMMREDRAGYFRSPEIQAEYRALLEGGTEPAPAQQQPQPAGQRPVVVTPANAAEIRERLGADFEAEVLERAGRAVTTILGAVEPSIAHQLESSFDGLPPTVRAAIIGEIGRPEAGLVKVASSDEIEAFRILPGGRELVSYWGQQAPRKVAVAVEAYNRLRGSLSAADLPQFRQWFKGASPREKQLMLWQLGGA